MGSLLSLHGSDDVTQAQASAAFHRNPRDLTSGSDGIVNLAARFGGERVVAKAFVRTSDDDGGGDALDHSWRDFDAETRAHKEVYGRLRGKRCRAFVARPFRMSESSARKARALGRRPYALQAYVGAPADGSFEELSWSELFNDAKSAQRLERATLPLDAVRALGTQLGALFGCVHRAGYFHGDAHSTNNLLVLRSTTAPPPFTSDLRLRVVDWGNATRIIDESGLRWPPAACRLTRQDGAARGALLGLEARNRSCAPTVDLPPDVFGEFSARHEAQSAFEEAIRSAYAQEIDDRPAVEGTAEL